MRLMMELLSRPDSCSRLDTKNLCFSFNIKTLESLRETGPMSKIEPGQYTIRIKEATVRRVYLTLLVSGLLFVTLTQNSAQADESSGEWKQSELTEHFMRSLSKSQCMEKTISSLKSGCASEACLKTLGGISGDCTTWASGDLRDFCVSFDKEYLYKYCWTNKLDARSCMFLALGKAVSCKSVEPNK